MGTAICHFAPVPGPAAPQRLKELQAEKADSPLYLRIEVEGGGCSGFQYKFNLDGQLQKDDV